MLAASTSTRSRAGPVRVRPVGVRRLRDRIRADRPDHQRRRCRAAVRWIPDRHARRDGERLRRSTPEDQPFFALYTPTTHTRQRTTRTTTSDEPHRPPSYDADVRCSPAALPPADGDDRGAEGSVDEDHEEMTEAVPHWTTPCRRSSTASGPGGEHARRLPLGQRLALRRAPLEVQGGASRNRARAVRDALPAAHRRPRWHVVAGAGAEHRHRPTIAELAGIPWDADGRSLVRCCMVRTSRFGTRAIEACDGTATGCWTAGGRRTRASLATVPFYRGIVTDRYKYVEYVSGAKELYDLDTDPYEQRSIHGAEATRASQNELATQLDALMDEPEPETTIVTAPERWARTHSPASAGSASRRSRPTGAASTGRSDRRVGRVSRPDAAAHIAAGRLHLQR